MGRVPGTSELFFKLLVYFWLCWVFTAVLSLSLAAERGCSLPCGAGTSHCVVSLCGARALEHRLIGLVALRHVRSFKPGIEPVFPAGRQILTTKGVPLSPILQLLLRLFLVQVVCI